MRLLRVSVVAVPIVYLVSGCAGPDTQTLPQTRSAPVLQRTPDSASLAQPQVLPDTASPAQVMLPSGYSLTDTTEWGNPLEDGKRAILRRNGVMIDTVDVDFGVIPVGTDSVIYLAVRTHNEPFIANDPSSGYESFPTEHVFWTPSLRRELRHLLPFFKSYSSSPSITDASVIHYWGIGSPRPPFRVYAMRYDFRTAQLDSLFTRLDDLGSDYRYYLAMPRVSDTEVDFGGHRLARTTWRLIPAAPPSN